PHFLKSRPERRRNTPLAPRLSFVLLRRDSAPCLRHRRRVAGGALPGFDPVVDLVLVPADGHRPELDSTWKSFLLLKSPDLRIAERHPFSQSPLANDPARSAAISGQ